MNLDKFKEDELKQIIDDAEVLTQGELQDLLGGGTPPPCSACCLLFSGGGDS